MMAIDVAKTYRPAQWWEDETATLLDIANVLGRWETAKQWSERTEFAVVEKVREEDMAQAATIARYDYARRQGQAERCALAQNVPKLPFTNAKLAAAMGKTVEEMDRLPINPTALGLVFDVLVQSKSSLLLEDVADERRARLFLADGSLDEGALVSGLYSSRVAVTTGFILLGKGQLYGYAVAAKILLDATGAFEAVKSALGSYAEPLYWVLSFGVAAIAVRQSIELSKRTANYELMSREEAEAAEERMKNDPSKQSTVFSNLGK